jgi:hypothetical protein
VIQIRQDVTDQFSRPQDDARSGSVEEGISPEERSMFQLGG